jgi:hypothetical protein
MVVSPIPFSQRNILLGIILYSFLYTIPKTYQLGKRGRKNILKALKKTLKIYYTHEEKNYLKLIKLAEVVMENTKEKFSGEELEMLNPGSLFGILESKYPTYLEGFEINPSWIHDLKSTYVGTGGNGFISIKYTNKLIEEINKKLEKKEK